MCPGRHLNSLLFPEDYSAVYRHPFPRNKTTNHKKGCDAMHTRRPRFHFRYIQGSPGAKQCLRLILRLGGAVSFCLLYTVHALIARASLLQCLEDDDTNGCGRMAADLTESGNCQTNDTFFKKIHKQKNLSNHCLQNQNSQFLLLFLNFRRI